MVSDEDIAVCGLVCEGCDMIAAATDQKLADEISAWFQRELHKAVKPEDIHCGGCRGERSVHWSADCWILRCCLDKKGLSWCWQCPDFPCPELAEWAESNKRYGAALKRLEQRRREVAQE